MRWLALIALTSGLFGITQPVPAQLAANDSSDTAPQRVPASQPKPVVELFTSQGCSSCPSADAVLAKLANRDDVIALSLPVDYWDYLGWKDTLASPKFSERQRAYAHARGDGAIYTPQAVVNGLAHLNGADEASISRTVEKTAKSLASGYVPIKLTETKEQRLIVEAGSAQDGGTAKAATLWLAVVATNVTVPITRGENQGRTVTYANVVRELMPIGMWNGKPMTVQLERHSFMRPGADRCAVFLQQGKAGPIIGAALLNGC
ncbi:MAG TPA: DUF1223 domain-containing protein [Hyphomicrobiaceae bacterium]|nr:DUF1223 domain-containing protein [Hyphomicrobiaceae bacterium]